MEAGDKWMSGNSETLIPEPAERTRTEVIRFTETSRASEDGGEVRD